MSDLITNLLFSSHYGKHRTNTFSEIWPTKDDFIKDYEEIDLGGFEKEETVRRLYYLIYSRHGNDAIYSSDENRFKYQLFGIVMNYGGEFEKKLEIQKKLINLSDAEIEKGTTQISNYAKNPSTHPMTEQFEQLKKIDQQNAMGYKKSKIDALSQQSDSLTTQFIDAFLNRFDKLFNPFPAEFPLIYCIEEEEDE